MRSSRFYLQNDIISVFNHSFIFGNQFNLITLTVYCLNSTACISFFGFLRYQMYKLQKICLINICQNLNLNLKMCKKNGYKIPGNFGNLLFDLYSQRTFPIKREDLDFFLSDFVVLNRLNLTGKLSNNLDFFSAINKNNLKSIKFSMYNNGVSFDCLEKTLENCNRLESFEIFFDLHMPKVLSIKKITSLERVILLLRNSCKTLQTLRLNFSSWQFALIFNEKELRYYKNLRTFELNGNYFNFPKVEGFFKALKYSHRTLEELSFDLSLSDYFGIPALQNFTRLTFISINILDGSVPMVNILKNLLPASNTLKTISLSSFRMQSIFKKPLIYILENFRLVERVKFSVSSFDETFYRSDDSLFNDSKDEIDDETLQNLRPSAKLKFFYFLNFKLNISNLMTLVNILEMSCNLEELVIDCIRIPQQLPNNFYLNYSNFVKKIILYIEIFKFSTKNEYINFTNLFQQCQNTQFHLFLHREINDLQNSPDFINDLFQQSTPILNGIVFNYWNISSTEYGKFDKIFQKFNNLKIVRFKSCKNLSGAFEILSDGLLKSAPNLVQLDFSYCSLSSVNGPFLEKILRQCRNLEVFKFLGNPDISIHYILDGLINSSPNLKVFQAHWSRGHKNNFIKLNKLLRKLINLEIFCLFFEIEKISKKGFKEMCEIIYNYSETLKEINGLSRTSFCLNKKIIQRILHPKIKSKIFKNCFCVNMISNA